MMGFTSPGLRCETRQGPTSEWQPGEEAPADESAHGPGEGRRACDPAWAQICRYSDLGAGPHSPEGVRTQ